MSVQLSFSAAQKYKTSPRAWYLHYVLRLREKNLSSALFFGAALDQALNALLEARRDGRELPLAVAQEIFTAAWTTAKVDDKEVDLSVPGVVKFSKADGDLSILTLDDKAEIETTFRDEVWVAMKRKGLMMIEAYVEQILPRIKEVIFVQKDIRLENEHGDVFVGFVDFCAVWEDGRTILFDNKSSSVVYDPNSATNSEQLATYYEATRDEVKVDAVGFIVLPKKVRKKKAPLIPIDVVIGDVSEEVIEKTFRMYDEVLDGIKNERFECTRHLEDGCCSAPWGCTYRNYCLSGGKDTTGLVFHKEKKK